MSLHAPIVTMVCAGVLGFILAILSFLVGAQRGKTKVLLGDGGNGVAPSLYTAFRSQANFVEYVPLCVILLGALEALIGSGLEVKILGGMLVVARVLHPIGMPMAGPNPYRAGGAGLTILMLVAASEEVIRHALLG
jgi:uncharacterized membrane protein YecN with MAPEG domain